MESAPRPDAEAAAQVPPPMDATTARDNFHWMILWFSLSHGCVTTPIVYASSLLDSSAGNLGNALLYISNVVAALLIAVPLVNAVGLKGSLRIGMTLYAIYAGCFAWSLAIRSFPEGRNAQLLLFSVGSSFGGVASGLMWTVQGGFLSRTSARVARGEGKASEEITGELAAFFASYYLAFEFLTKVAFSMLQYAGMVEWRIGMLYFAISVLSVGMMRWAKDIPVDVGDCCPKVLATLKLWAKPTVWLLSPINITFGCAAAYMNGAFNEQYGAPQLGEESIGILSAMTVLAAAIFARILQAMTPFLGGKGGVLTAGALAFAIIPLAVMVTGGLPGWGWWLTVLYVCQGLGRAVYESTNKAIFSDFFRGEETEPAFANCSIQMSLASAVCFLSLASAQGVAHQRALVAMAVVTPLAFYAALALQGPHDVTEAKPLVGGGEAREARASEAELSCPQA